MPFVDIDVKFNRQPFEKAKRTEFITLTPGAHTIRILEEQAKTKPTHFFNATKATVLCLGEDCPICANNKKLIMQFPDNFREQAGYNKVNYRFFVNVLDKTPAKVCGKCGKEHKNLTQSFCASCGEVLPTVASPLNKVKVLSKGIMLRDALGSIENAIQGTDGTPLGLTNYDVILMVSGRETTPVARTDAREPIPQGLELFDLEKALIVLDPAEMLDVQRGTSIKDIFAARRGKSNEKYPQEFMGEQGTPTVASEEELNTVADAVNSLFERK